jgi:hypothetical protein
VGEKLSSGAAQAAPSPGRLAAGLLIVRVLAAIPFLGVFVWAAMLMWGAGALCMALWNCTRLPAAPSAA